MLFCIDQYIQFYFACFKIIDVILRSFCRFAVSLGELNRCLSYRDGDKFIYF